MRVGIDIIEGDRFQKLKQSHREKIFTTSELEYAENAQGVPMRLAGIYAVKEAFLKALGCGLGGGIKLTDIEVKHTELGKPYLELSGTLKKDFGIGKMDISISHTDKVSVAICILED